MFKKFLKYIGPILATFGFDNKILEESQGNFPVKDIEILQNKLETIKKIKLIKKYLNNNSENNDKPYYIKSGPTSVDDIINKNTNEFKEGGQKKYNLISKIINQDNLFLNQAVKKGFKFNTLEQMYQANNKDPKQLTFYSTNSSVTLSAIPNNEEHKTIHVYNKDQFIGGGSCEKEILARLEAFRNKPQQKTVPTIENKETITNINTIENRKKTLENYHDFIIDEKIQQSYKKLSENFDKSTTWENIKTVNFNIYGYKINIAQFKEYITDGLNLEKNKPTNKTEESNHSSLISFCLNLNKKLGENGNPRKILRILQLFIPNHENQLSNTQKLLQTMNQCNKNKFSKSTIEYEQLQKLNYLPVFEQDNTNISWTDNDNNKKTEKLNTTEFNLKDFLTSQEKYLDEKSIKILEKNSNIENLAELLQNSTPPLLKNKKLNLYLSIFLLETGNNKIFKWNDYKITADDLYNFTKIVNKSSASIEIPPFQTIDDKKITTVQDYFSAISIEKKRTTELSVAQKFIKTLNLENNSNIKNIKIETETLREYFLNIKNHPDFIQTINKKEVQDFFTFLIKNKTPLDGTITKTTLTNIEKLSKQNISKLKLIQNQLTYKNIEIIETEINEFPNTIEKIDKLLENNKIKQIRSIFPETIFTIKFLNNIQNQPNFEITKDANNIIKFNNIKKTDKTEWIQIPSNLNSKYQLELITQAITNEDNKQPQTYNEINNTIYLINNPTNSFEKIQINNKSLDKTLKDAPVNIINPNVRKFIIAISKKPQLENVLLHPSILQIIKENKNLQIRYINNKFDVEGLIQKDVNNLNTIQELNNALVDHDILKSLTTGYNISTLKDIQSLDSLWQNSSTKTENKRNKFQNLPNLKKVLYKFKNELNINDLKIINNNTEKLPIIKENEKKVDYIEQLKNDKLKKTD